jgi:type II secretory pathway predicted ATPase ExeA
MIPAIKTGECAGPVPTGTNLNPMSEMEIRMHANEEIIVPAQSEENVERPLGTTDRWNVDQQFLDYFGLSEQPFGVTPDLRFLYFGPKHQQALDVLNYATELSRGFVTFIAKPGMGKTSVLFHYLEGLRDKARTVFLCQTDGDSTQLMRYLLAELGIDGKGMDLPEMRAALSQVLLGEMQAGRRFVLVVDEAQNLDEKVLEFIRLLSNFETPWMKLMHIVLAGQPQLAERLAKPSMAQLQQRVSYAIRLEPFTREEVDLYINHRLWIAGYKGLPLFSIGARTLIAERSEGIPRVINNLCFRAMSHAWAMRRKTVERDTICEMLADMGPAQPAEAPLVGAKMPELLKPTLMRNLQPIAGELKPPPVQKGFSKYVVGCLAVFAVCWLGLQPNVEKWIGISFNNISVAVRSYLAPEPVHPIPAPVSGNSSVSGKSLLEGQPEKGAQGAPQAEAVESSSTNQGRN